MSDDWVTMYLKMNREKDTRCSTHLRNHFFFFVSRRTR